MLLPLALEAERLDTGDAAMSQHQARQELPLLGAAGEEWRVRRRPCYAHLLLVEPCHHVERRHTV